MNNTAKQLDSSYKRDHDNFIGKLQEFHDARGTPIGRIPSFGGQPLDLFAFYNTVTSYGGISVVTDRKKWGQVFRTLGFPPCTNADYALRQHYARYLEAYERIFFFGEDTDDLNNDNQIRSHAQMLKYRRLNKPQRLGLLGEPLVDNFNRISFSLQSGLQNEVNFALNICSLLSNVSNSIFNLAKSPKILDLILAHVGIWTNSGSFTKQLYVEWYNNSDKNFEKFWLNSIDEDVAKKIYRENYIDENYFAVKDFTKDSNGFFVKKEKKLNASEACRVNQICIILYNFSFEPINAMHLASHDDAVRFLLLSCCCLYNNIRRIGLDALDNISDYIVLIGIEDTFTQDLLQILYNFLKSNDKFRRVRAMTILAKVASKDDNSRVLTEVLTSDTYKLLLETLYLPDISLILSSLDALYYLSNINEDTATSIAMIHGSIDILVCLVTVRAESYGNKAIQGSRIVENKHSIFTPKNQNWLRAQEERRQQMLHHPMAMSMSGMHGYHGFQRPPIPAVVGPHPLPPHMPPMGPPHMPHMAPPHMPHMAPPHMPPMQQPINPMMNQPAGSEPLVELDAEIFAAHWMSGFYEPHQTEKILIAAIHEDYVHTCKECKRNGILSIDGFTEVLRTILPPHLAKIIVMNEDGQFGITGIQRRKSPVQVHSKIPKSMHDQLLRNKQAMSSMRKQQQLPTVPNPKADVNGPELLNEDSNLSCTSSVKSKSGESEHSEKHCTDGKIQSDVADGKSECDNDNVAKDNSSEPPKINLLEGQKLDTIAECQAVIDKLKVEIQTHFVQFHANRQQIQVIQVHIQQLMQQSQVEHLPAHVVKDIQSRVQAHHQQMGSHYQKLQELNVLSEQVQTKMKEHKKLQGITDDTPEPNTPNTILRNQIMAGGQVPVFQMPTTFPASAQNYSTQSPMAAFQQSLANPTSSMMASSMNSPQPMSPHQQRLHTGTSFIVPPAAPFMPQSGAVPIQHSIPANMVQSPGFGSPPTTPLRGRGSRGGRMRTGSPRGRGSRGGRGSRSRGRARGLRGSRGSPRGKRGGFSNQQLNMIPNGYGNTSPMSGLHSPNSPFQTGTVTTQPFATSNHMSPPMNMETSGINIQSPQIQTNITSTQINMQPPMINLSSSPRLSMSPSQMGMASPNYNRVSNVQFRYAINQNPMSPGHNFSNNKSSFMDQICDTDLPNTTTLTGNKLDTTESHETETNLIVEPTTVESIKKVSESEEAKQDSKLTKPSDNVDFSKLNGNHSSVIADEKIRDEDNALKRPLTNGDSFAADEDDQVQSPLKKLKTDMIDSFKPSLNGNSTKSELVANLSKNNATSIENNDIIVARVNLEHKSHNGNGNHSPTKQMSKLSEHETNRNLKDELESPHINGLDHISHSNTKFINQSNGNSHEKENDIKCNGLVGSDNDEKSTNVLSDKLHEECKSNPEDLHILTSHVVSKTSEKNHETENDVLSSTKLVIEHIIDEVTDKSESKQIGDNQNCKVELTNGSHNEQKDSFENDKCIQPSRINGLRLDLLKSNSDLFPSKGRESNVQETNDTEHNTVEHITLKEINTSIIETGEKFLNLTYCSSKHQFCRCEWDSCNLPPFKKAVQLLAHMIQAHAPQNGHISACKVTGCVTSRKLRGAMISHFQEKHCLVKKEDGNFTTIPLPDARLLRVHDNVQHEDESPVTRSVRYTAALILRNIARNSSYGKRLIMLHETKLTAVAMSTSEAAVAVSQCLSELCESPVSEVEEDEEDSL